MSLLKSKKIMLYPLSQKDGDLVYSLFNDSEVQIVYNANPIPTKKDTAGFIDRITSYGNLVWSIRNADDPELVYGICALHHYNKIDNSIEAGGTLFPEFWGKGIMKQAFSMAMEFAKKRFGVETCYCKTRPQNIRAIRMVKKMGFEILGTDEQETILFKKFES